MQQQCLPSCRGASSLSPPFTASCSYSARTAPAQQQQQRCSSSGRGCCSGWGSSCSPSSSGSGSCSRPWGPARRSPRPVAAAAAPGSKDEPIQGYTPANYISFSEDPQHTCRYMLGVSVAAPPSVCFGLWDDWARLVDFLDLISQIGLDPEEPDMGLFQCFYRWGRMPVMEIVFLARKSHVEPNKLIQFETVWGLPAKGEVEFIADGPNTTVLFRFEHQMPVLLVDLKVGVLSVEGHLRTIFGENLEDFKQLAEMVVAQPERAPPRREFDSRGSRAAARQQQQWTPQRAAAAVAAAAEAKAAGEAAAAARAAAASAGAGAAPSGGAGGSPSQGVSPPPDQQQAAPQVEPGAPRRRGRPRSSSRTPPAADASPSPSPSPTSTQGAGEAADGAGGASGSSSSGGRGSKSRSRSSSGGAGGSASGGARGRGRPRTPAGAVGTGSPPARAPSPRHSGQPAAGSRP